MRNAFIRTSYLFGAAALSAADILGKAVGTAERPKNAPPGGYTLQINKREFGESSQKKTPYVQFHYTIVGVEADVDQSALVGIDLQKLKLQDKFYLTEDALYRLQDFLTENLKLDLNGRSFQAGIEETIGKTVIGQVALTPRTPKEGQTQEQAGFFNEIVGYRAAA